MSQRAHPGLSGTVHAAIAALDSVWCMEPTRALAMFEALRGVTWADYSARPGLMASSSHTIADGTYQQPVSYSPSLVPVDGESAQHKLSAALLVTEGGTDPADLVARDRNGWSLGYYRVGSVAVLQIEGTMQKQEAWSMDGTSTVRTRRALRRATADEAVESILLLIDSPGGTVSGTHDLALDVRAAASKMPVYAYCSDLCCSAAYYVASQANLIYANPGAMVGSIGVYATIWDASAMFEEAGVVVHVVRDGDQKGDFTPGTPVSAEQLARMQSIVDAFGTEFRKTVSQTRFPDKPLAKGASPADGGVFIGAEARRAGLIDGVTSLDNVLAAMKKKRKP